MHTHSSSDFPCRATKAMLSTWLPDGLQLFFNHVEAAALFLDCILPVPKQEAPTSIRLDPFPGVASEDEEH